MNHDGRGNVEPQVGYRLLRLSIFCLCNLLCDLLYVLYVVHFLVVVGEKQVRRESEKKTSRPLGTEEILPRYSRPDMLPIT
jgi:hypothetical protein